MYLDRALIRVISELIGPIARTHSVGMVQVAKLFRLQTKYTSDNDTPLIVE